MFIRRLLIVLAASLELAKWFFPSLSDFRRQNQSIV